MANFTFGSLWSAVVTVLITSVASNVYYVTTNSSDDSSIDINTLEHYLVNSKKYFASDSQLIFLPGEYQLDADLVFESIRNFTITAILPCKIYCASNTSILVVNVTEFELRNITLINCGKNHTAFIYSKQGNYTDVDRYMRFKSWNINSSVLFYHCKQVKITSINISVSAHFGGVLAMNVKNNFTINDVKVQLDCSNNCKYDHQIHGILLHYKNKRGSTKANVTIYKFDYKVNGWCRHLSRYAIKVLLLQNKYSVSIAIENTNFHNFNYSSILYYSVLSCNLKSFNPLAIH